MVHGTASAEGEAEDLGPPSRDDLIFLDQELRELYRAASLNADGRSLRGRKTKHNTASRRWIETVGLPALNMGKLPAADDLAMLRMSNESALTGADLAARKAWSQRHGRDPRSKLRTEDEVAGQTTLLAWAKSNLSDALVRKTVRRGRVANWKLDFGEWKGHTIVELVRLQPLDAKQQGRQVKAGAYVMRLMGSAGQRNPFRWSFTRHVYLYLALRELQAAGRYVEGARGERRLVQVT